MNASAYISKGQEEKHGDTSFIEDLAQLEYGIHSSPNVQRKKEIGQESQDNMEKAKKKIPSCIIFQVDYNCQTKKSKM